MSSYPLDRTAFKAQTAETWQERLRIVNYLNSIAYNYPENEPLRMDKTAFRIKKRDNPENSEL